LRLQHLDSVDLDRLDELAQQWGPGRLVTFAEHVRAEAEQERDWGEWES
jgi:hypothetical protein